MSTYNAIKYNVDYGGFAGSLIPISTFTSDGSDANATFNSSLITSDFEEYLFVFNNIHPQTDGANLVFHPSIDNGSNYNVAITTATFNAEHNEDGTATNVYYMASADLAQGTGGQKLNSDGIGADNDQTISGTLRLYNPSSTIFQKHFMGNFMFSSAGNSSFNFYVAGYANTTSAVNNVKFEMSSGEIQGGTIQLFGAH
jgi:hypothetical protein